MGSLDFYWYISQMSFFRLTWESEGRMWGEIVSKFISGQEVVQVTIEFELHVHVKIAIVILLILFSVYCFCCSKCKWFVEIMYIIIGIIHLITSITHE